MSHIPSRMSANELNLDRVPLAGRASSSSSPNPPSSENPPSRPPRRRSGISFGRVILVVVVLAAVAGGVWWFVVGRPGEKAADREEPREARQSASGLSDVPAELRPVIEYLRPSPAEVKLWMDSVLASSYVREKWGALADSVGLHYSPDMDGVNAGAFYNEEDAGQPSIALYGGEVRLARLIGALALVQSSAVAQGVEKDFKAYLRRVSGVVAETGELSEEDVIDLLNEFEVGTAVFQDVGAVSAAKGFADGICKAALAHEFGHLAGGHPRGVDLNKTVSQNEERQADLFASSIAASIANGQQMLRGQIWNWYTLALAETINPTNEIFRSHPYSIDRLRAAIEANKSLAASIGITAADVDQLVAGISSGRQGDGADVKTSGADAEAAEGIDNNADGRSSKTLDGGAKALRTTSHKSAYSDGVVPEVSSGEAMSPDQEVFNEICALAMELEDSPASWEATANVLRQYNQSLMKEDTKVLIADMLALCENLGSLERQIAERKETGEREAKTVGDRASFDGAFSAAYAAQQMSGGRLGFWGAILVGGLGGMVESDAQTAPIKEATNKDVADLKRKMTGLVKDFGQCLDKYRAGATYKTFDKQRLLDTLSVFGENDGPSIWEIGFRCKVPELTLEICSETTNLEQRSSWYTGYIVEWPKSRIVNCETLAKAYLALVYDACTAGKNEYCIAIADKGIEFDPGNGDLYEVRGIAKLHQGKPEDAKTDVERAIATNPHDGNYDVAMARVLAAGFKDKAGAIDSIQSAYKKGFCQPQYIKGEADFNSIRKDEEFVRMTTVKFSWGYENNLFTSTIWVRNDSPFTITHARIEILTDGWRKSLPSNGTVTLTPGEQHAEGLYSQPPDGRKHEAQLECDQLKSIEKGAAFAATPVNMKMLRAETIGISLPRVVATTRGASSTFSLPPHSVATSHQDDSSQVAVPEVSSGKAMSPDQEVFNEICLLAIGLEVDPSFWKGSENILRQYNRSLVKEDTKALISEMLSLCEDIGSLERRIAERRKAGEEESQAVAMGAGFETGVQRTPGTPVASTVVQGGVNAVVQTASIREATNNDIADMKRQMEVLLEDFGQRLDEYRAGPIFQTFDRQRLFDEVNSTTDESSLDDPKILDAVFRCKVPEFCFLVADLLTNQDKKAFNPEYKAFNSRYIVEWPKSRKIDSERMAKAYLALAFDACAMGKDKECAALADKGLEFDRDNGDLHVVRGIAKLHLGKPEEAKEDVERAIATNPHDGNYDIAMARVLAAGFNDKTGATNSIQSAYGKGFSSPQYIKGEADFNSITNDAGFVRMTTGQVCWGVEKGWFFSDIWMRNDSPFPITHARLKLSKGGWKKTLPSDKTLKPGKTEIDSGYSKPPAGGVFKVQIECDQFKVQGEVQREQDQFEVRMEAQVECDQAKTAVAVAPGATRTNGAASLTGTPPGNAKMLLQKQLAFPDNSIKPAVPENGTKGMSSSQQPLSQPDGQTPTGNSFSAVQDKLVLIECGGGSGSGFLARMDGKVYLVSNEHVLRGAEAPKAILLSGETLTLGAFSVATDRDLARFELPGRTNGLEISTVMPTMSAPCTIYGNSDGEDVVTELKGAIIGVGPKYLETDAEFVSGNSGSPVLDASGKVMGAADRTYNGKVEAERNWGMKDTKFDAVRRFAVRLDGRVSWKVVDRLEYESQVKRLYEFTLFFDTYLRPYLSVDKVEDGKIKPYFNELAQKKFGDDSYGFAECMAKVGKAYERRNRIVSEYFRLKKDLSGKVEAARRNGTPEADIERFIDNFYLQNDMEGRWEKTKDAWRAFIQQLQQALSLGEAFLAENRWDAPQLVDGHCVEAKRNYGEGIAFWRDIMNRERDNLDQRMRDLDKTIREIEGRYDDEN